VDLSTSVYIGCAVIAGGLLLITVVADDFLGSVIEIDLGGVSLFPLLFGFVSMFGIGGLIGQFNFGMTGREAALVGAGFGLLGTAVVWGTWRVLKLNEADQPPSLQDLIGKTGRVSVGIPAGRSGTIFVTYAGAPQSHSATAGVDVPAGSVVRIVDVAGPTLVVVPLAPEKESTSA
jgi:membrane-bound ClpP family serine protease